MNEKVDVEIAKRRLSIEMEGLTELEIITLAKNINDKIASVSHMYKQVDSHKILILVALEYAADLSHARDSFETAKRVAERKIEELTLSLQSSLSAANR